MVAAAAAAAAAAAVVVVVVVDVGCYAGIFVPDYSCRVFSPRRWFAVEEDPMVAGASSMTYPLYSSQREH